MAKGPYPQEEGTYIPTSYSSHTWGPYTIKEGNPDIAYITGYAIHHFTERQGKARIWKANQEGNPMYNNLLNRQIRLSAFSTEVFSAATVPYHRIDADEACFMMSHQKVTIVDVRQEDEYKLGHIPGAILIPDDTIGNTEPKELPDKDATILLYCKTGSRSIDVAFKLIRMGYRNIYDFGGMIDWPYSTTRD